ncbi:hypothetical protein VTI28DRAFT_4084 [Corynascus sepedonium]
MMTDPSSDQMEIEVPAPNRWQYSGQISHNSDPYVTWELRHPDNTPVGITKPDSYHELAIEVSLSDEDEDNYDIFEITRNPMVKEGSTERYPWVVRLYSRNLAESSSIVWPWDEFKYIIPTKWAKGTAWFARGISNDEQKPIYLMTAAHNLVKKVPRDIDIWGRPMDNKGRKKGLNFPSSKFVDGNPYQGMHESRARADAVLIVAVDFETGQQRFMAWADRASISQKYLRDPNANRFDIAALRLHQPFTGDFPTDLLENAPYIHSLKPKIKHDEAFFMGVGIPGFLDKYRRIGGTYLLRNPDDRGENVTESDLDTVFSFSPSRPIEVRPIKARRSKPTIMVLDDRGRFVEGYKPKDIERRFDGTLVHQLPYQRMPFGVSGGPGILGVKGKTEKLEMVVCCMVIEDKGPVKGTYTLYNSGGAIFSSTGMTADAADPAVLLAQLGATDLMWESITFNGEEYMRLSRRKLTS